MKGFFAGLTPKLFQTVRGYTAQQALRDVISGIIVAVIALPLSIALAIASGVSPEKGLYTAVFAGFCISFFGGSRVQIGGPTAAFVVLVCGIAAQHGAQGLILATLMAGVILLLMGVCKLGSLIRFIPHTITVGFTCGIAVTLLIGQLKDFLGMTIASVPAEAPEKLLCYAQHIGTVNGWAAAVGLGTVLILVLLPKLLPRVPASLIAIVAATLAVKLFALPVSTIGSVFGQLSSSLPAPSLPSVDFETVKALISPAFTIALLAAVESLLSCVVADGMIGDKHNPNAELIGQGLGNICSALFGGIPATGAIARTAANVKNGGRTPVAGIVHAITLLLILLLLMPLASLIPMTALAAVLIVVACNMCEVKPFIRLVRTAPKSDVLVLVLTFMLTVVFDLVVAIAVGVVLAALLFLNRMSRVAKVRVWEQRDAAQAPALPQGVQVVQITGPLFFAAADRVADIAWQADTRVLIVRMGEVPAVDADALRQFNALCARAAAQQVRVIFTHLQEQPLAAFRKDGLYARLGESAFYPSVADALQAVTQ